MTLGLACDLTWYKLLTDWGSFIGGLLALIAGGLAYLAGLFKRRLPAMPLPRRSRSNSIAMRRKRMFSGSPLRLTFDRPPRERLALIEP